MVMIDQAVRPHLKVNNLRSKAKIAQYFLITSDCIVALVDAKKFLPSTMQS